MPNLKIKVTRKQSLINFPKNEHFLPLIRIHCYLSWDSPFCLLTDDFVWSTQSSLKKLYQPFHATGYVTFSGGIERDERHKMV